MAAASLESGVPFMHFCRTSAPPCHVDHAGFSGGLSGRAPSDTRIEWCSVAKQDPLTATTSSATFSTDYDQTVPPQYEPSPRHTYVLYEI